MSKMNFNTVITNFEGVALKESDEKGNAVSDKELTLSYFSVIALSATYKDEPDLSGVDKCLRGALAQEVYDADDVDVSPEDVVLIKKLIGKSFGPLIVSKCYAILDK